LHKTAFVQIGGIAVVDDVTPAGWIVDRLTSWGPHPATVSSFLPSAFDAYARVLHPAYRFDDGSEMIPVRWRDLPRRQARIIGTTSFLELTGWQPYEPEPGGVDREPQDGDMDRQDLHRLTALLADWTTTPDSVWFCIWTGYGWKELPPAVSARERVRLPNREHWLCHGSIDDALSLPDQHAPTLWWPEDRAWCVSTEVNAYSTYLAARASCIDALIHTPTLEAVTVNIRDPFVTY
jgi:hypothetical protein